VSTITHRRRDSRLRTSILAAAILWAVLLLALAPGARGVPSGESAAVDEDSGGAPYVAGELLVVYEPGTPEAAEETVVRESGAKTLKNLPGEMRLLSFAEVKREGSGDAREQALQRELTDLREDPRVEAADYNYFREATSDDPRFGDQWGLTKARFPGAWNTALGTGANIAFVDSGIDSNHPDIGKIVAQHDFVEGDVVADDDYGHGTHVAGIAGALTNNQVGVAGGCPECGLLVAKVMNAKGLATDADVIDGIDWSVTNGADVINLSLGGPADSDALKDAINSASAGGAVVVAAAGNEGTTRRQYPAAYPAAIAVSATTEKDKLAGFSSYGSWVDLAAPGTHILSTQAGGGYVKMSGTSMSTPFVSALAGLLASQGIYTADQIRHRMEATAADLGPAGKDPYYGHGRINANNAVE
jgi:thermitase